MCVYETPGRCVKCLSRVKCDVFMDLGPFLNTNTMPFRPHLHVNTYYHVGQLRTHALDACRPDLGLARLLSHVSATFLLFFCTTPLQLSQNSHKSSDAVTDNQQGFTIFLLYKILYFICTYSILLFVLYSVLRTAKAYYLQSVLSRHDCTKIVDCPGAVYKGMRGFS